MRVLQFLAISFTSLVMSLTQASNYMELISGATNGLPLVASSKLANGKDQPFLEHIGAVEDRFGTTLAMNTPYAPIASLRKQITRQLSLAAPLKFFTGFANEGEAHVTTVTPVEYHDKLRAFVSPEKMTEIALQYDIQASDLQVLGIGKGSANLAGQIQDTYFVIVYSENLLQIRRAIYEEYLRNNGPVGGWDPEHFYPHITIGYTERDLHESDGVKKDVENSLDTNFAFWIRN